MLGQLLERSCLLYIRQRVGIAGVYMYSPSCQPMENHLAMVWLGQCSVLEGVLVP